MKITIVMGFFLPVPALAGGATEKIWHRLAQLFAAQGHAVTLVSRRWPGLPNQETIGGLVHLRLPGAGHSRFLPVNLFLDFIWGLRVTRALPSADVVICNTVSLPAFLRRLKPRGGPVAVVLGRMPKGQCRLYGNVDRVLATSAAVARRAAHENPRLAARTSVFPNPIDWTALAAAPRHRDAAAAVVIGFVGRVHPEKGLPLLLAAAAQLTKDIALPPWQIKIVGPESIAEGGGGEAYGVQLRADLPPAVAAVVTFTGPEYDTARLAAHYSAMDVFCYPSIAERGETFGISIAESMAAGCAPVVSALDCFRDLIAPEQTGLVFDHAAPDAAVQLATQLGRLISNPSLRRAIAARAKEHARRYDFPECARVVLASLQRCIDAA
ncbi:glycosyltransferase family 4 protein [Horticoccus luteus]|uniref:Glycosyltransferase family 4 protein n=1 Tax=Horticoccus luteus TaxID=2862869 RepID=A0A8F9TWL9_9BACT|nr:glycosyltransferase family 4 protein [Horticoccus luteus]QYM80476.1 glycosyltransferase family 4 protein [Horticoccus luteus]